LKKIEYRDLPYFSGQLIELCETLLDEILFLKGQNVPLVYREFKDVGQNKQNQSKRQFTDERQENPLNVGKMIYSESSQASISNLPHQIFNSIFYHLNPRILSKIYDTRNSLMQNSITYYMKTLPSAVQNKIREHYFEWDWDRMQESDFNVLMNVTGNFEYEKVNRIVVRGDQNQELARDELELPRANEEAFIVAAKKFKNLKELEFDLSSFDLFLTHRIVNDISDSCKYLKTFICHITLNWRAEKQHTMMFFKKCKSIEMIEIRYDELHCSDYFKRSDVIG